MDLEIFGISVRVALSEPFGHRLQLGADGLEAHTGLGVRHQRNDAMGVGDERHRHVDVGIVPGEPGRDNAQHRVRVVIEFKRLTNDCGVAVEVPFPEEVADDGDTRRVLGNGHVTRGERATQHCGHSEMLESVGGKAYP